MLEEFINESLKEYLNLCDTNSYRIITFEEIIGYISGETTGAI